MNNQASPSDGSTMAFQAKLLKQLSVEVRPLTSSASNGLHMWGKDPSHGQLCWSIGDEMAEHCMVIMC